MRRSPPIKQLAKRGQTENVEQAILRILKMRGEMTVSEFCRTLKLTHTAVRRHLSRMLSGQVLSMRTQPKTNGRPVQVYRLAAGSADFFPSSYENLLLNILDTIFQSGGHRAVMDLLKANDQRLLTTLLPAYKGRPMQEKVEILAELFNRNGFMTAWKYLRNDCYFVYHQNCAIYSVAVKYRQCCVLEPRLMEVLLDASVIRQQYILKGKPICGYLVTPYRADAKCVDKLNP